MRLCSTLAGWLHVLALVGCTVPGDGPDAGEAAAPTRAPPSTLDEAMDRLDAMLSPEDAAELATGDPSRFHHSLGMSLRNAWGLWDEASPLSRWFAERGILHPDDMSGIVLTSWQRRRRNEPIDLEGQVAEYRAYWAKRKRDYEQGTGDGFLSADLVEYSERGWASLFLVHMPYVDEFAQSVRARAHGDAQACFDRMTPTTDPDSAERTRLRIAVDRERRITKVTVVETRSRAPAPWTASPRRWWARCCLRPTPTARSTSAWTCSSGTDRST